MIFHDSTAPKVNLLDEQAVIINNQIFPVENINNAFHQDKMKNNPENKGFTLLFHHIRTAVTFSFFRVCTSTVPSTCLTLLDYHLSSTSYDKM